MRECTKPGNIQSTTMRLKPLFSLWSVPLYSLIFLITFAIFSLTPAHAATVTAVVDRTRIGPDETIELTVSVTGGEGEVDMSPIRDFKVLSSGTGASIQIINGQMSKETNYAYRLIPLKQGRLVIPPLTVTVDNTTSQTAAIVVTVSPNMPEKAGAPDVFAEGIISNSSPYDGEPVVYTFRLYHAVQIANARFQKPEFAGFTAKELENSRKDYRTVKNGRDFNVTDISFLLVPVGPGQKTIDPTVLSCDLVMRQNVRRNPFGLLDDPFFGQNRLEPRIIRTEPLNIAVRALPSHDGKGTFSGLVGTFQIRSNVDKDTLKVGESATLSVTISGTGNILDAAAPDMAIPDAFRSYQDTPQETIQPGENGYSGEKVFRTALVPLKAGQYTLDPVELTYFDATAGQYQTLSTAPISVTVHPSGDGETVQSVSSPDLTVKPLKKTVEFTGRDILPLKEDMKALETQQAMSPVWFGVFLLVPGLLCLGIKMYLSRTTQTDDPASLMARRADQALADACRPDAPAETFLTCLSRSVISILLAKAGVRGESLTYAEAKTILLSIGFSEEDARAGASLLERIDSARFSGREMDSGSRERLLSETRELIRKLS